MKRCALVLVLALGLLLAACSRSGQQGQSGPAEAGSDEAASEAKHNEGEDPRVDPQAVLLTLEDMPSGWREGAPVGGEGFPARASDGTSKVEMCGKEPLEGWDVVAEGSAKFSAEKKGPFVVHTVRAYDEGQARKALAAFAEARDSCEEWTDDHSPAVRYRHYRFDFPEYGQEMVAVRLQEMGQQLTFTRNLVVWRRGDVLSTLMLATVPGPPNDGLFESMVETADARLERQPE